MTTLVTGLSTDFRGNFAAMQGRVYYTNDFDPVLVWNPPKATTDNAGIIGPAGAIGSPSATSGNTSNGSHLIRYRYQNSQTGYYSNPSDALAVVVSGGNGTLTFGVPAEITKSTDAKVDTIVVEMTPVNSPTYYIAVTAPNANGNIVVNIADQDLIQGINVFATISVDGFGQEPPPLCAILIPHNGRMFALGATTRTRTATLTNNSTAVTGTGFSLGWAGRLIAAAGDTQSYIIDSVASSTSLTLATAYGGTTGSKSCTITSLYPNRIYWSQALYPEGFEPSSMARDCLQNKADEVRGAWSYLGDLYLFGRDSCERLSYNVDPGTADGVLIGVPGTRGTYNQSTMVEVDGILYSWDRLGMYALNGALPVHLSKNIDPTLRAMMDYTQFAVFHCSFDPVDRVLFFFFVAAGDTAPYWAACYDLDNSEWMLANFRNPITSSKVMADANGQVRMLLGDGNGYSWFYGIEGTFDGVPPTSPTVVTVDAGSTTTSVNTIQALPTGTPNLAGVVAYDPLTSHTAVISANTNNGFTCSAFASTPTVGQELWLGSIDIELQSKWWTGEDSTDKKRPFLQIRVYPGSPTGQLKVFIYLDFSTTPFIWTAGAQDQFPKGVTVTNGAPYISCDMTGGNGDGYLFIPMPRNWQRAIQYRIVSDRPDGDFRLLDARFVLQVKPGPKEERAVTND